MAQTIERTGKRWKGLGCLAVVCLVVGIPCTLRGLPWGYWVAGAGVALFLVSRAGAWWHHE